MFAFSVDVQIELKTAWVDVNPTRIAQVLGNLLQNAAKLTPKGGEVTLTATASWSHVNICVRDTGEGIAPELKESIFEPFVQIDSMHTSPNPHQQQKIAIDTNNDC